MNYIAWLNGSKFRIPHDAQLDQVGQVIEENQTCNDTTVGRLKVTMNCTIQDNIRDLESKRSQSTWHQVVKQLRQLFCDYRNSKQEFQMLLLFAADINMYFFVLYNSSQLKGNPIQIVMLFGLAEVLGIIFGERFIHMISDRLSMLISLSVVLALSFVIKYADISENTLYVLFMVQIFFVGSAFNILFVLQDSRINPKLLGISFEINYSFG